MWFPPHTSLLAFLNQIIFIVLSALTAFNFVMAAVLGPSYLPLGWKPKNKKHESYLQLCTVCPQTFKAPRAHHCRKCDRCVAKMVCETIDFYAALLISLLLGSPLRIFKQLRWLRQSRSLYLVPNFCSHWLHARCCDPHRLALCWALPRLLRLHSTVQQSRCKTHNLELNLHSFQYWTFDRRRHCRWNAFVLPNAFNNKEQNGN